MDYSCVDRASLNQWQEFHVSLHPLIIYVIHEKSYVKKFMKIDGIKLFSESYGNKS